MVTDQEATTIAANYLRDHNGIVVSTPRVIKQRRGPWWGCVEEVEFWSLAFRNPLTEGDPLNVIVWVRADTGEARIFRGL